MKNLLFFLFTVCFISTVNAQIINFTDANLKARLLLADNGVAIAFHNGTSFKIDSNNDNEIQVSEALLVNHLIINNCGISDLNGLEYFINLKQLNCGYNSISTLNLSPFINLISFDALNNNLTSLTVSNLNYLTNFSCDNNQISSLTLTNLPVLSLIRCANNLLTSLSLNNSPELRHLICNNNLLTTLDANNLTQLTSLNCASNNLNSLYIKNGANESASSLDFSNNPNLEYVCADDFQLVTVQDKIMQYGFTNCFANSYCAYVPGGSFNSIQGSFSYDEANDGCDASDVAYPNLNLSFSNGTNTGNIIGTTSGNYNYPVQNGTHTIQPIIDNPTYFNVSPTAVSITFPTQASPYLQNFCITPNGLHPDLEISISIVNYYAYPGGENTYRINYKNKGTNTQSGTINFNFNDAILNYIYSNPTISSQVTNTLEWNFSNLKPFESREILLTLHLNSNLDLPSVIEGDLITYTTTINSTLVDETPSDNSYILNQTASFALLNNPNTVKDISFVLYPNPTATILNIEANEPIEKESIQIYNSIGQLVMNIPKAKNSSSIDVSHLNTGNYFIIIQTDNGIFKSKFLKK